jgi:hypothetical protein
MKRKRPLPSDISRIHKPSLVVGHRGDRHQNAHNCHAKQGCRKTKQEHRRREGLNARPPRVTEVKPGFANGDGFVTDHDCVSVTA